MKKKDLLSMKKLEATKQFKELVQCDIGETVCAQTMHRTEKYKIYERYLYFRAVVENDILKVAVFARKHIANGINQPHFEIYISKKENKWITYAPLERKWYTAKIDRLQFAYGDGYRYGNKPFASERTKKIINDFLGTGKKEVKTAILSFQNDVKKEDLRRKHKSEMEEIDAVMNIVPELPKDFEGWVIKDAFINNRYIFYKSGSREGKCTYCDKKVILKEKPIHNKKSKCPMCKSEITYKAWNKQKKISDKKYVGLMQKLTDDSKFVLRKFKCKVEYEKVKGIWKKTSYVMREVIRVMLPKHLRFVDEYFEFGEYKNTGIRRWCHEVRHIGFYYNPEFGSAVIYPRNLTKLLKETGLKYIPVKEMLSSAPGEATKFEHVLQQLVKNPKYEFLIKAGLKRFTYDMCEDYSYNTKEYIDEFKKKPWEYLKLNKEIFQLCCKKNASGIQVRVAQIAGKNDIKMTWAEIEWTAKYIGSSTLIEVMKYTTPHRMIKYLIQIGAEKEDKTVVDYMDYIEQCKKLGWEINRETMFPKNFHTAHEQASRLLLEKEEAAAAEKKRLQDMQYRMTLDDQKRELYKYEDDKYTLILPECKDDFINEGREMHNCVGGYFERVIQGECTVLFLRKKDAPEKSFCTIEIAGGELQQCRAAYNQKAPEGAENFMEKFLKVFKKRLEKGNKERNRIQVI